MCDVDCDEVPSRMRNIVRWMSRTLLEIGRAPNPLKRVLCVVCLVRLGPRNRLGSDSLLVLSIFISLWNKPCPVEKSMYEQISWANHIPREKSFTIFRIHFTVAPSQSKIISDRLTSNDRLLHLQQMQMYLVCQRIRNVFETSPHTQKTMTSNPLLLSACHFFVWIQIATTFNNSPCG